MKLFHYTVGLKINSILNDGFLKLTPDAVQAPEMPCCWFSSNDIYEGTARKIGINHRGQQILLTVEQMHATCQGVYRFTFNDMEIPTEVFHWNELKHKLKMSPETISMLERNAVFMGGNKHEWFGTTERVSICNSELQMLDVETLQWKSVSTKSIFQRKNRVLQINFNQAKAMGLVQ